MQSKYVTETTVCYNGYLATDVIHLKAHVMQMEVQIALKM